jgi:hypothetical protein
MITDSFQMKDAAVLAQGEDDPRLYRLILEFDTVSNAGDDENPRWVRDGESYHHVATFRHVPGDRLPISAAIDKARRDYEGQRGCRYTYLGYELLRGTELSKKEKQEVEWAESMPEYYRDTDAVYLHCGWEGQTDFPARWAPAAFAKALLEARERGAKAAA